MIKIASGAFEYPNIKKMEILAYALISIFIDDKMVLIYNFKSGTDTIINFLFQILI